MDKDRLFDLMINLLPANIFWKDRQGIFLGCNLRQAKSDGFSTTQELLEKTAYETCKDPTLAAKIIHIDEDIMTGKYSYLAEEEGFNEEGRRSIYLTHKVPIPDAKGNTVGLLGLSLDITDRKEAEQREQEALLQTAAANAKAQAEEETRQAVMIMAGSIGHDLRTPLAALALHNSIFTETLPYLLQAAQKAEEAGLVTRPDEIVTFIPKLEEFATASADCLLRMQEDITDSLKMLKQVVLGDLSPADLSRCELYSFLHGLEVRYPFESGQRAKVHWDNAYNFPFMANDALFYRVLCNLLKNSLQQITHTGKGEIFISAQKGESYNEIHFKDTAGGAPPEIVAHIFEGYKTTKQEGTGVGLAFCKMTMERFGGTMTCHSVEGDYIEFVLSFPKIAA